MKKYFYLCCALLQLSFSLSADQTTPVGPGTIFAPDDEATIEQKRQALIASGSTCNFDAKTQDPSTQCRSEAVNAFLSNLTPAQQAEYSSVLQQNSIQTKGSKTALPEVYDSFTANFQVTLLPTATTGPNPVTITAYVPANLFPGHADLAQTLTDFLARLEQDKGFVSNFTKLHFFILHQLYEYLTKVYTTFNLTHINTMDELLDNESKTTGAALNKKTLIVTHLFSLIEAQINGYIQHQWPTLPQKIATPVGTLFHNADYGTNYELMFRDLDTDFTQKQYFPFDDTGWQNGMKTMQSNYLKSFGMYLGFTKSYTESLSEKNKETGLNEFLSHAQTIKQQIDSMIANNQSKLASLKSSYQTLNNQVASNSTAFTNFSADAATYQQLSTSVQSITDTMTSMEKLRPPLFFYSDVSLRAIRIIPPLAEAIPPNSKKIPYPQLLVNQAAAGTKILTSGGSAWTDSDGKTYQVAAFYDAQGNLQGGKLSDAQMSSSTFVVNIPQLNGKVFRQVLIPQPDWLNSTDGIMNMLRACLGDFSVLLRDPNLAKESILDPFIASIVYKAALAHDSSALGIPAAAGTKVQADAQAIIAATAPPASTSTIGTSVIPPTQPSVPGSDSSDDAF